jgi:hypothetical protein
MPKIDLGTYGDLLFDAGIPGMDADINISSIVTYTNGVNPLDVGMAVAVNVNGVIIPPDATHPPVGITVRHPVWPADATGSWMYPPNAPVPVMEFGRVWAICVAGCNVGDAASAEANGTSSVGGTFPIPGAIWDTQAAAGGIAIMRVNRP